jgi:ATP-dependent RNA helicase DOB1
MCAFASALFDFIFPLLCVLRAGDGDVFRIVTGGEYIQMSGRAGRRGIDDKGIVIAMMDEQLEPVQAKEMIKGQSDCLNSAFHLGYNMLLNLLRSEDQTPAKMMARSFLQFQNTRKAPKLQGELEVLQSEREAMSGQLKDAKSVREFHDLLEQLESYRAKISAFVIQPQFVERFLNPGRVVHVKAEKAGELPWGWGVLLSYSKNTVAKESRGKIAAAGPVGTVVYVLQVLLKCAAGSGQLSVANNKKPKAKLPQNQKALFSPAAPEDPHAEWLVVPVLLQLVDVVSQVKSNIANRNMQDKQTRSEMGNMLHTLVQNAAEQKKAAAAAAAAPAASGASSSKDKKKGKDNKPAAAAPAAGGAPDVTRPLDPVSDMKIGDPEFLDLQRKVSSLEERVTAHKLSRSGGGGGALSDEVQEQLSLYRARTALDAQIVALQLQLKAASEDVNMKAQLRKMKSVLHRLGFTDAAGVVTAQKGGAACAISTSDELLVVQLMFEGVFAPLTPAQTVALCSALVFNEKSDDAPRLREELAAPLRQLQEQARRVGQVQSEAGLALDVDEYVAGFQSSLMDVVYAWCGGASFSEVCKLTDVFEGTIIRCLRRLEELLRQMAAAAKSVGDAAHEAKFTAGCALLKRDIVFAASLYL